MNMKFSWSLLFLSFLLWGCFCITFAGTVNKRANTRIAVLGAGMAGVTVVERLQELGYSNIIILEGGNRVGGRMKDVKVGNCILQEGANWIQSLGKNPIFKLAKKYGLKYVFTDSANFRTYDKNGDDITSESKSVYAGFKKIYNKVEKMAENMIINNETDATYRSGLIRNAWLPITRLEDLIEYYKHDFEFAYPPDATSLKESVLKTYDIHESDDDANVIDRRGYAHIPKSMLREIMKKCCVKLYLNRYVDKITQTDKEVIIRTKDNEEFKADYVVVTFSIGVLQNRLVEFHPKLPQWKLDAIDQIQIALYYNVFLQFPYQFWGDNQFFLYASERRGYYPVFQNINKLIPNSNILHVTVTENEAERIHRIPRVKVKMELMEILNKIYRKRSYGRRIPRPLDYSIPQWFTDPLFMGTFTNIPPGYTPERQLNLSVPLGRLYFAGEAYSVEHNGYVHGAWYSGVETAEKLNSFISSN